MGIEIVLLNATYAQKYSVTQERRKQVRLRAGLPVLLKTPLGDLQGKSRDLSIAGFFLLSPVPVPLGTQVRLTFSVPPQNRWQPSLRFGCNATVVRLEPQESGGCGVALTCGRIQIMD